MGVAIQSYTNKGIDSPTDTLYFGKDSHNFKTYRLDYPEDLVNQIMSKVSNNDELTCIDVGSGAGHSCKWLLEVFDSVLAIEPDNQLANCIKPHSKLKVFQSRVEDTIINARTADLVTCATAFHWLNAQAALNKIHSWLKEDGCLAVYQYRMPQGEHPVFSMINKQMNSNWKPFRHERLLDENYAYREISNSSKFNMPSMRNVPYNIILDIDHLIGFLLSTSFVGRYIRSSVKSREQMKVFIEEIKVLCENKNIEANFEIELITATPRKI